MRLLRAWKEALRGTAIDTGLMCARLQFIHVFIHFHLFTPTDFQSGFVTFGGKCLFFVWFC